MRSGEFGADSPQPIEAIVSPMKVVSVHPERRLKRPELLGGAKKVEIDAVYLEMVPVRKHNFSLGREKKSRNSS